MFRPQGVDAIPVYCDLTSLGLLKGKLLSLSGVADSRRDFALCDGTHRLQLPVAGQSAGEGGRQLRLWRQLGGQG